MNFPGTTALNNVSIGTSAAALENTLENLLRVPAGTILVSGSTASTGGGVFTLIFTGVLGNVNAPALTVTQGTLAGPGAAVSAATAVPQFIAGQTLGAGDSIQTISFAANSSGGSYTINLGGQSVTNASFSAGSARSD